MSAPTFALSRAATPIRKPMTLALTLVTDPNNLVAGDLHLENGQLHWWDGAEAHLQKVTCLLKFVKGEWILNVNEGVPYFTHILIHNPNLRSVQALLKQALLAAPGAVSVPLLRLTPDTAERSLAVEFEVAFDDGTVLRSADFPPFILRLP